MVTGVQRLQPFGESPFARMTKISDDAGSINLGQGFPDTSGPARMREIAAEELMTGDNQYAPARGVPALRQAISEDRGRRLGQRWDPDREVLVTVGATEGITASILGLVEPGDEVILIDPYYDAYAAAVAVAGATRVSVPVKPVSTDAGQTWDLDAGAVARAVTPKTRMIILNSPHNPTGAVFSRAELETVAAVARDHNLFVLSDEVYEHILFGAVEWIPVASLPGMRDRTVTVSSIAKTFNATGWKTGWVLAEPDLLAAVQRAKQYLTFAGARPLQPAAAHGIAHETEWLRGMVADLERNRDRMTLALSRMGALPRYTAGTFFVVADMAPMGCTDSLEFAMEFPVRTGVTGMPVTPFSDHPDRWGSFMRFAFAKRPEVIEEAARRLEAFAAE